MKKLLTIALIVLLPSFAHADITTNLDHEWTFNTTDMTPNVIDVIGGDERESDRTGRDNDSRRCDTAKSII